jgi:hypothetical protein
MKKIYFVLVLTIAALSGCSGYAYSGYNPINDPFGATTRTEIHEREATKRQDIVTGGDVEMKKLDSQARSDEASYDYKARSDEAYYDYQAQKAKANSEMIQGMAWATITPITALILIFGLVLVVALIQAAKVLLGRPEFVPNLDDEYWRKRL